LLVGGEGAVVMLDGGFEAPLHEGLVAESGQLPSAAVIEDGELG
jgi:hypothetical protein